MSKKSMLIEIQIEEQPATLWKNNSHGVPRFLTTLPSSSNKQQKYNRPLMKDGLEQWY